jgi:hypothetical protein
MKMLLSLSAALLAISASTISAEAACVGGDFGNYFVICPPTTDEVEQPKHPKHPHKKAHRPAPVRHVAKRPKPQHRDQDEKAPAAVPPPALPPH